MFIFMHYNKMELNAIFPVRFQCEQRFFIAYSSISLDIIRQSLITANSRPFIFDSFRFRVLECTAYVNKYII